MKNKTLKAFARSRCAMPMNLQFFAEGGNGDGENGGGSGGSDNGGSDGGEKPVSFDDFLKGDGNQAEFDRRVNKAVQTALANAKEKWDAMTNDKLSEAEKLAKMTKEEKDQYNFNKRLKDLEEREKAVARGELLAEAKKTLAEKNVPIELAEFLDLSDADKCNTSIDALEKAFSNAVAKAVDTALKGKEPPKKAPGEVSEKEFKDMTYAEKLELKTKNPALYKKLAGK